MQAPCRSTGNERRCQLKTVQSYLEPQLDGLSGGHARVPILIARGRAASSELSTLALVQESADAVQSRRQTMSDSGGLDSAMCEFVARHHDQQTAMTAQTAMNSTTVVGNLQKAPLLFIPMPLEPSNRRCSFNLPRSSRCRGRFKRT